MMANLLNGVELPAAWEQWGIAGAGVAVAGLAFVVGRRMLTGRPAVALPPETQTPTHDPFESGSSSEKRVAARRKGASLEVLIADEQQRQPPHEGWVVDRSLGGLCLASTRQLEPGTFLRVRPKNAEMVVPWVEVEVRSCKLEEGVWQLGCQFRKTPPYSVLLLFG